MDDTLESHATLLEALADRERRKSIFRPGLGRDEALVYRLIAERLESFGHCMSIPQIAEYLGTNQREAFDLVYGLVNKGWLKVQSVTPRQPWWVSRWRGRFLPTLEASAFQHLYELVEIAMEVAELRERPAWKWKLDARRLRSKAEAVIAEIAEKTARPTYLNFNKTSALIAASAS